MFNLRIITISPITHTFENDIEEYRLAITRNL